MNRTFFAFSVAALFASNAAFAGTAFVSSNVRVASPGFVAVQQYDRWDDRSANINERESRIRARIDRGINDGRITRGEANRLYRELRDVEAKERAFRSDGYIDRRENRVLTAELDRLADHVRHELRDEQRY